MEIPELLAKIDAVDFLSQYTELEERGGEYWGLSPLADPPEKTPSFSVRRETGKFYCFSTGHGGSLIAFLKLYHHISGWEAVEILKKYAGLEGESLQVREKLAATSVCQRFSPKKEPKKPQTNKPLPETCMEKFEWCPEKLRTWEDEGISVESMEKFHVRYDPFSDRIVYPVRNADGKPVNISGRTLDPDYKEKGLRKYTYFYPWGGAMNVVYGLWENLEEIRAKKEIILFEGCKSVLLADTWGVRNTGALLTSHVSQYQLRILAKLGVRTVFALDKDVDIFEDRQIKLLKRYLNVEYLLDTDDLLGPKDAPVDRGKEVFLKLYQQRRRMP